ncbi:hypothetical protein MML48_7g00015763 [Holotrichia oblita]|uniref:Ubiquitin-conjugating enzyme e2 n=2 Tax=Holotrichia oblita TaxID=644536 RepID=A0ACB9SRP5_HOLOL|nr:ubiquitin-conjugating enzyme e2 [Holotrichia oblita]KAI4458030.1 hypothetical protein MML48_7g00015763 [Holotrichia oblita]
MDFKKKPLGAPETLLKELALEYKERYGNHLRMSEERFDEPQTAIFGVYTEIHFERLLPYMCVYRVPKNTISNFVCEVCTAIYDALQDLIKAIRDDSSLERQKFD